MRAISKRKFVEDWIEKTFEPGAVSFSWQDGKAIVKDGNGEEMRLSQILCKLPVAM